MSSGALMVSHGSTLLFNKDLVVSAAAEMERMKESSPVTAAFMQPSEPDIMTGWTLMDPGRP